jgi:hypothetical protein
VQKDGQSAKIHCSWVLLGGIQRCFVVMDEEPSNHPTMLEMKRKEAPIQRPLKGQMSVRFQPRLPAGSCRHMSIIFSFLRPSDGDLTSHFELQIYLYRSNKDYCNHSLTSFHQNVHPVTQQLGTHLHYPQSRVTEQKWHLSPPPGLSPPTPPSKKSDSPQTHPNSPRNHSRR